MASRGDPAPCESRLLRPEALAAFADQLFLGTSSWSFPGWEGLIYDRATSESNLSRKGLIAYAQHPLLNAVGIDRGFYAPVSRSQFETYASQVSDGFRFLVKAPDLVTGATLRDESGRHGPPNPSHLDAACASAPLLPTAPGSSICTTVARPSLAWQRYCARGARSWIMRERGIAGKRYRCPLGTHPQP